MTTRLLLALAGALAAAPALAHTGIGDTAGFAHGFLHPMGGMDHLVAMLAVGILAAQLGGRALYTVPLAFMATMAVGGAMGIAGVGLPYVETGIALSLVAFGLAIALQVRLPVAAAAMMVGAFALFHGGAHGAEMPETTSGLVYAAGFVAATGLLHLAGITLGLAAGRGGVASGRLVPASGAGVALVGALLLARVI